MGDKMTELILKNCTIINHDKKLKNKDIVIKNNKIIKIKNSTKSKKGIDLSGMIVLPGLVDMHAHFREPGEEYKEDLYSGSMSAIKGGYTAVAIMPNTKPPLDSSQSIAYIKNREKEIGLIDILPFGAISKEMKSEEITEMYYMIKSGAVGFSDDGYGTYNSKLLYNALRYVSKYNVIISTHCEDTDLSADGQINESNISLETGLNGIPEIEEDIVVYRNASIATYLKAPLHIAHISTKSTLDVIKLFKKKNKKLTCEVTPHHLIFNEKIHKTFNTNYKIKPPLRTEKDNKALLNGIINNQIDVIATDHAPHQIFEKEVEFIVAPFGMLGLETSLVSLYHYFIKKNKLDYSHIAKTMAYNPSKILNIEEHYIKEGNIANITVFNPHKKTVFNQENLYSKSQNTPFINKTLNGAVEYTIYKGKIVYKNK